DIAEIMEGHSVAESPDSSCDAEQSHSLDRQEPQADEMGQDSGYFV
ncbi:MAG: hypothetical protein K0R02_339, partial [Rickettsiaceae bacterium]|nr:hypothetical protein [Rickettsiaceae bacterium]